MFKFKNVKSHKLGRGHYAFFKNFQKVSIFSRHYFCHCSHGIKISIGHWSFFYRKKWGWIWHTGCSLPNTDIVEESTEKNNYDSSCYMKAIFTQPTAGELELELYRKWFKILERKIHWFLEVKSIHFN